MCNEIRRRIALGDITEVFSQLRIPLRFPEALPNLPAADSVRITDPNPIVRMGAKGPELVVRRWSWPQSVGKPLYNLRSEGRSFDNKRCLVIADGFYEFTTPTDPKAKRKHKWLFTPADAPILCIAGLWRASPEVGEAFTMLTAAPGPDVAPYHGRQIVLLDPSDWVRWLDPAVPSAELLQPSAAGFLAVEQVA